MCICLSDLAWFHSLLLFGDESVHGEDRCLHRKDFFGKNAVNFWIGVKASVLEDDAAEIQVERAPDSGKSDAAGEDAEENKILNAARAKEQVELILRECAHTLLINNQIFRPDD